jgi:DNA-binding transcriptional LysR family regulator
MISLDAISDLDILDHLELYGSTVECAKKLNISQSSCSRRYRAFSDTLGLEFDYDGDSYCSKLNLDVLATLREANQKVRIRSGQPRVALSWQLGDSNIINDPTALQLVDVQPMSSWTLLSMIDRRLVDLAVMGLYEFQGLLNQPLATLKRQKLSISDGVECLPLCRWILQLVARSDHPLQQQRQLSRKDLANYPSPSLPLGVAPHLMVALQSQGLASQPCGLHYYESSRWEGFAAAGQGLSYCTPATLAKAASHWSLSPLPYNLGITECMAVVGHRDVLGDSGFARHAKALVPKLKQITDHCTYGSAWLLP